MQPVAYNDEEIVAVERRIDVRIIVNVPGRYSLSTKRNNVGERREFACRALNMSPRAVLLAAPVKGPIGDKVVADIDAIGRVKGAIVRLVERGFVMSIDGTEEDRVKFAARLLWFEQYRHHELTDNREHERIVPRSPLTTLMLPDGRVLTCLLIDMSISGAAVSADVSLEIGAVVAIGRITGRVVRRFPEGFAVQFTEVQQRELLEQNLVRR